MSSKVIYPTDILSSSDDLLDGFIIGIHVLQFVFVSAIVMMAFEIKFKVQSYIKFRTVMS